MLNIVIPMAGNGSRFSKAGYLDPKPLIPVHNVPMIKVVIDNLRPKSEHRFIFICRKEHDKKYNLTKHLSEWAPGCIIIFIDGVTDGAACTVLEAKKYINSDNQLMIANSDQYIECSIDDYIDSLNRRDIDGLIMTMKSNDPKWSYVGLDEENMVTHVVEKKVISNEATVGIYNFKNGADFVSSAEDMIAKNQKVNGEFYVAPTYNILIGFNAKIGVYNVGEEGSGMHGLGTPDDLNSFLKLSFNKSREVKL